MLLVAPATSDAASRTLSLDKNIAKGGSITSDLPGIDCGLTCTEDSGTYQDNCVFNPGEGTFECSPDVVTLTAAVASGFTLAWTGCDDSDATTCTVSMGNEFMGSNRSVTATFTDVGAPNVSL